MNWGLVATTVGILAAAAEGNSPPGQIDPANPGPILGTIAAVGLILILVALRRYSPSGSDGGTAHAIDREQFEAEILASDDDDGEDAGEEEDAEDDGGEEEPSQPVVVEFGSEDLTWPLFSEAVAEVAAAHQDEFDFYRAKVGEFQDLFQEWSDERYHTAMYDFDEVPFVALFRDGELVTTFNGHEQPGGEEARRAALKRQLINFLAKMEIVTEDAS